jgi:integrase
MASLYKRERSPHWWLRTKVAGVWRSENTGLRHDSTQDTKRARLLVAERTYAEASAADATPLAQAGWKWVGAFLKHRAPSAKTLDMYQLRWRHVAAFLEEHEIEDPSHVSREHATELIEWRMSRVRPASGKTASRNTALLDLKMLSMVMTEAVARGLCAKNPLTGLKLAKDVAAEKPEISLDEQAKIEAALADQPQWMQRSWQIAMSTGCRLRETAIELRNVDLVGGSIHFPQPKGGRGRAYTVPLPAALRPLFETMAKRRERKTLTIPFQPSRAWRAFFDELGLNHLCFHCTRVTFVTRLARANAPLSVAMALVNHSSELVHRLYRRTRADELSGWADRIAGGQPAPAPSAKPRRRRGK